MAADDGACRTIEAINRTKAPMPIIVAVNKIDRRTPTSTKRSLAWPSTASFEEWGDTIFRRVSALQNIGVDELLDQILLVAEVEDLRRDSRGRARASFWSRTSTSVEVRWPQILVQSSTFQVGDPMVAGAAGRSVP